MAGIVSSDVVASCISSGVRVESVYLTNRCRSRADFFCPVLKNLKLNNEHMRSPCVQQACHHAVKNVQKKRAPRYATLFIVNFIYGMQAF